MEDDERKKKIGKIMSEMQCSKGFTCAENNFERLCSAKDFVLEEYVECLETNPSLCQYSIHFGYRHFCRCPLRVFLTKEVNELCP